VIQSARFAKKERIFTGIELIIAEPTSFPPESWKGHSLLRIIDTDNDPMNDLVLSYTATAKGVGGYIKGALGMLPSEIVFLTVFDLLGNYVRDQHRALYRYVIPTSIPIRYRLTKSLEDWFENPSDMKNYKLLKNNCSRLLTRYFSDSGIMPEIKEITFPVNIPRYLRKNLANPYPVIVAPTLKSVNEKLKNGATFTDLSDDEIVRYSLEKEDLSNSELNQLAAALKTERTAEQAYNLTSLPLPIYEACYDSKCAAQVKSVGQQIWPEGQFESSFLSQEQEIKDVDQRIKDSDFSLELRTALNSSSGSIR
jgi:hypothetical protein